MKNFLIFPSAASNSGVVLIFPVLYVILVFSFSACTEPSPDPQKVKSAEVKIPLKIPADSVLISISSELENILIKSGVDLEIVPDGKVKYADIKNIDSLDIRFYGVGKSLKGLEYFTGLRYLKVRGHISAAANNPNIYYYAFPIGVLGKYIPSIDTLNVSHNLNLEYLDCSGDSDQGRYWSSIGNLKLGDNRKLKTIISYSSMIKSMDLSGLDALETLEIYACYNLTSLSLCKNKALVKLKSMQLKTIYVSSLQLINPGWEVGSASMIQCN